MHEYTEVYIDTIYTEQNRTFIKKTMFCVSLFVVLCVYFCTRVSYVFIYVSIFVFLVSIFVFYVSIFVFLL